MNILLLGSLVLTAAAAAPEPIELKSSTGSIHGTLDLPEGKGPWPVVIVHAGSGPTDRDGNNPSMKNDSLKKIGAGLANESFAVLRFDKRGIAESAKSLQDQKKLTIDQYAQDVVDWVKLLRMDKRFSKVVFIGHSEGSTIGLIAAKEANFDAFISLCGPGRPFDVIVCEQISKDDEALGRKSREIFNAIAKGEKPSDIPAPLASLFNESVQPYIQSILKHDSVKLFSELKCPALIVSGTTDIQVSLDDAVVLEKANPKAKIVRIVNMNHVLNEFKGMNKLLQLVGSYNDSKKPLHSKLIPELSQFLKAELK